MIDLNNGAATPKLRLSSSSGFGDLSPFEYAFQGLLDDVSSADIWTADLCAPLEDKAGALKRKRFYRSEAQNFSNGDEAYEAWWEVTKEKIVVKRNQRFS